MDIISGLNKVICVALNDADNGKPVTITNGSSTWTATITGKKAEILIPALPVPARKEYSISFGDFSRKIDIGYGDMITVVLADGYEPVLQNEFDEYKEENGKVLSGIARLLSDAKTDAVFNFGVDAQGRYGYIKAGADSVIPFRTGAETLCYYLGQGRTFDIVTACSEIKTVYGIDLDYRELTSDNFVVSLVSGTSTGSWSYNHSEHGGTYIRAKAEFTEATCDYTPSSGKLDITGAVARAVAGHKDDDGDLGSTSKSIELEVKAYLIISMN